MLRPAAKAPHDIMREPGGEIIGDGDIRDRTHCQKECTKELETARTSMMAATTSRLSRTCSLPKRIRPQSNGVVAPSVLRPRATKQACSVYIPYYIDDTKKV